MAANLIWLQFPGGGERLNNSLSLAAVEEAGGEEDDGDHEGEAGVEQVAHAQAEERVRQPRCEAHEPDPRCLSHHRSCSGEKLRPG